MFLCVFIVPKYIVQRTIVKGTSMENTLHNGDNLLVEKVSYLFSDPERFDIVVFYPYGKDEEEYYVKRVIGLPGETIQIIGSDIFIDGEKLDENYGKEPITYAGIASSPYKLNDNEFFVIGDNRTASFDSRYVEIGPVTREKLSGQVILRMYPFDDFGIPD
ncbi:MAG: signal peptidase I [Lachnospiraceae bacterium]|nr:signal peptidase I [Lachnospiraceae bacterium]